MVTQGGHESMKICSPLGDFATFNAHWGKLMRKTALLAALEPEKAEQMR
jgi:hypothetical protein